MAKQKTKEITPPKTTQGRLLQNKELLLWVSVIVIVGIVLGLWIYNLRTPRFEPKTEGSSVLGTSDTQKIEDSIESLFQELSGNWDTSASKTAITEEELSKLATALSQVSISTSTPSTTHPTLPQ